MKRIKLVLLLGLLVQSVSVRIFAGDWQTLSSKQNIQDVFVRDPLIWCATDGGLFSYNTYHSTYQTWTNTEGLASNNVLSITGDGEGGIWLGMHSGMLQRYNPETKTWFDVMDFIDHPIYTLQYKGDTLFVGLDIGLSIYILSRQEVKETYRNLGENFQSDIAVHDIFIQGQDIWLATDEGIARSSLNYINLLDPNSWTNVTDKDGLPATKINCLIAFQGQMIAGTGNGAAAFIENEWQYFNEGFDENTEVSDFEIIDGLLYTATSRGLYTLQNQTWTRVEPILYNAKKVVTCNGNIWTGTPSGLATKLYRSFEWTFLHPTGPGGNRFADLVCDEDGILWCCSGSYLGNGFYSFDGENWETYNRNNVQGLPSNAMVSVAIDKNNNRWFGTWGGGLIYFGQDSTFRFYNSQNGFLSDAVGTNNYPVVSDLAVDSANALWLLNWDAKTNLSLVSVTTDSVWTYFGASDNISTDYLETILIDDNNNKWIGTRDRGVLVLNDAGTPDDKSDDQYLRSLNTNDGLLSNEINSLAEDRLGNIWVATVKGLHLYADGSVDQIYNPPADNIKDILVDGVNNVWVATNSGIGMFSPATYEWTYYRKDNSGLVSDDVVSMTMDLKTGKLYIGTNEGLSILQTSYSEPLETAVPLYIYPNPFIPAEHGYCIIDNLTWNTTVHIFTASGHLVRSFIDDQVTGKQIRWDGRDNNGMNVPGGIYIIAAGQEEGDGVVAKVALIR